MSNVSDSFHSEDCVFREVFVHNTKPVWIVFYDAKYLKNKDPFYVAYQVKDYELPLKKGKAIWSHDNFAIDEFKTLDEAMEATA